MTTKALVLIAICCCLVLIDWPVNATGNRKFWNWKSSTSKQTPTTTASEEQQETGQPSVVKLDQQLSEGHQPRADQKQPEAQRFGSEEHRRFRSEEHQRYRSEEHQRYRPESYRLRPDQHHLSEAAQQYHQSLEILAVGTYSSQEEAQAAFHEMFPGSSGGDIHGQRCSRFDVNNLLETDKQLMAENPELRKAKRKFAREISSEGEDLECGGSADNTASKQRGKKVAREPTKLSKLLGQTAEKTKQVGRLLTKIFTLKNGKRALFIILTVPPALGIGAALGGIGGFGIGILEGLLEGWKVSKKWGFRPLCIVTCPVGVAWYAVIDTALLGAGGALVGGTYAIGGSIAGFDKANKELSEALDKQTSKFGF